MLVKEPRSWTLTDVDRDTWIEHLDLSAADMGLDDRTGASITKRVLRGGLSDGVDLVEIDNGRFSFSILPTRGMGLWRGSYRGRQIGWQSPVRGPVHPKYVRPGDRGGLGWLEGFDECIVRCGLESNGAPCTDVLPNNMGVPTPVTLSLHGRIANLPAHFLEVSVEPGEPSELCVSGIVDEAMLFCPQLRLTTEVRTRVGSNRIHITDRIRNLRRTATEMELLYHCNFGEPVIGEGASLSVPGKAVMPRDARAAEDALSWASYLGPTAGYVEQCYWHVPLADAEGNTVALLANARDDFGVAVRYNVRQLPCFTQWKNTGARSDGYVTGLEPGTNYPNGRDFERRQGRVLSLEPDEEHRVDLVLEVCDGHEAVSSVRDEVERLQDRTERTVHVQPVAGYSDLG